MKFDDIVPVRYVDDALLLLDQTRLPGEEVYIGMETKEDVWDAIFKLKVRGAPAIGVAAAWGLYISVRDLEAETAADFAAQVKEVADYLNSSRPTAVNLSWALKRMVKTMDDYLEGCEAAPGNDEERKIHWTKEVLKAEARRIHEEDVAACKAMGEHGLSLLKPGMGILTHCNAGTIATAKYGTCLAPLYLGHEKGYDFKVFADETRPLLQGARLTSWELNRAGIDVTLICDNMASIVMRNGWIQACFVGCDRIAANGDFANKIGTSGVAILAKHYGIPVYTLGPSSTIDMSCPDGEHIEIELRDPNEIKEKFYAEPMALKEVKCYNPAFDVTDHELLTGIVTEKGIVYPPFDVNLKKLFG